MKNLFKPSCFLLSSALLLASINTAHAVGETVSLGSKVGDQSSSASTTWSSLSADGRYIALTGVAGFIGSVFVYDRLANSATNILPTATNGTAPEISADGRYIAFRSDATNLISNDGNGTIADIFVYDRQNKSFEVVSKDSNGVQGNDLSHYTAISADGNVVAFSSSASNLVTNDTNNSADVFVHNRSTKKTSRVSVSSAGAEGNMGIGATGTLDISANGRYVVFSSPSNNLASNDTNTTEDIFLRDTLTGTTTAVSAIVRDTPTSVSGKSTQPSISADGRFIAFQSGSSKLMTTDTDDFVSDIFVYDRLAKKNSKITVNSNGNSVLPRISADGRFVVFISQASNLVANDTNGAWDTFVYDRNLKITKRINLTSAGLQSVGEAQPSYLAKADLSADGRFISFESAAKDLTADDTDNALTDVFLHDRLLNKAKTADVGVAFSAPDVALLNQNAVYTVTVTNAGAAIAANSNLIMQIPAALTTVALTPSQGNCVKGIVTVCRFGAIAKGAKATVQLTLKGLKKGNVQISATARSGEVDAVVDNNSATHFVTIN